LLGTHRATTPPLRLIPISEYKNKAGASSRLVQCDRQCAPHRTAKPKSVRRKFPPAECAILAGGSRSRSRWVECRRLDRVSYLRKSGCREVPPERFPPPGAGAPTH